MQVIINKDQSIEFDLTKDFNLDSTETTDIEIDYSIIKDYLDSNPNMGLIDFGHQLVSAVEERLING